MRSGSKQLAPRNLGAPMPPGCLPLFQSHMRISIIRHARRAAPGAVGSSQAGLHDPGAQLPAQPLACHAALRRDMPCRNSLAQSHIAPRYAVAVVLRKVPARRGVGALAPRWHNARHAITLLPEAAFTPLLQAWWWVGSWLDGICANSPSRA